MARVENGCYTWTFRTRFVVFFLSQIYGGFLQSEHVQYIFFLRQIYNKNQSKKLNER